MRRGIGVCIFLAAATTWISAAAQAEVWQQTAGTNFWGVAGNWSPANVPNAVGATASFTLPTTGVDFVAVDAAYTVGTLLFDLSGSTGNNDHRLIEDVLFPGGTLTLEDTDNEARITVQGNGIPNVDLSIALVLNDNVVMDVATLTAQSAAGALSIDGAISGTGGVTKIGPGTLTYITGAKTYTGPTEFQAGKIRIRNTAAAPTESSSVRILDGSWIEPDDLITTLELGAGTLYLNGDGNTNTFTAPGGVIRPERSGTSGAVLTIPNVIVLESDSVLHLQTQNDTSMGSMTLSGVISGPGALQLTHVAHNEQIGSYILTNTNTYTGGTELRAGMLRLNDAAATLGTGDVWIMDGRFLADGTTVINGAATSQMIIGAGVANAIDDSATLTLGTASHVPTIPSLDISINETVESMFLGTTQLAAGTYDAADLPQYITGSGSVTVLTGPATEDADFDNDNDVDGADFLIWQRGLGTGTDNMTGDADGSGTVDGADLDVWKTAFGTGAAVPAVGAIPEPATMLLAAMAGSLAVLAGRKR